MRLASNAGDQNGEGRCMAGGRRTGWRLVGSSMLALLLMAGCSALAPEAPQQPPGLAGTSPATTTAPAVPTPVALPRAPAGAPQSVLGVIGDQPTVLARLDPRSLRPLSGWRLELDGAVYGYGWSPDRSTLVLGDNDEPALYVVDAGRLRLLGEVTLEGMGAPIWVGWLGPRRVTAVTDDGGGASLELIDPLARRVLTRRMLGGALSGAARVQGRVVLLLTPNDAIGPVRLAVVSERGAVRTVTLRGIAAGFQHPAIENPDAVGRQWGAGLAVDEASGRAFVVAAGAPVAEVDLASLRITYHALRQPVSIVQRLAGWLVPPAEAKLVAGPVRQACWLGDGLLAVWGSESRPRKDAAGQLQNDEVSSGVKLLDTRRWTVRPLHQQATAATYQDGRLLVFGGAWSGAEQRSQGTGLTVYGPGNHRPAHLFGSRFVGEAYVNGHLAYVGLWEDGDAGDAAIVDLRTAHVLSKSPDPLPYLLLGDDDHWSC